MTLVHLKRSTTPDAAARLRAEAALLETARHRGVVEVLELTDTGDTVELRLVGVNGPCLADAGPLTVSEIADIAAEVASTLADLHDRGLVHGRVDTSHVLLDGEGRPVLCGLADARLVADGADAAADVLGLGGVINELLASGPGTTSRTGRDLEALGRLAADDDPTCRPPARLFAESLRARIPIDSRRPPSELTARSRGIPRDLAVSSGGGWPRARKVPAVVLALAATGVGAAVMFGGGARQSVAAPRPTPPSTAAVTTAPPDSLVRVWPTTALPAPSIGDIAVTADWACRGRTTVAMVRPATGGVYVFDRWPDDGEEEMQAVLVTTVAGAIRVRAADSNGDGCIDLVVERADGAPVVLPDVP